MKKLLILAAAMTIVSGAYADWSYCGATAELTPCEIPVWDFQTKGLTATMSSKGYKAVQKMAMKGYILGELDGSNCCLEAFSVLLYDKPSKTLVAFDGQEINTLTVFGKYLNSINDLELKPGKSKKLESDVMWQLEGEDYDGNIIELQFVGFGKTKGGITKEQGNTSACGNNASPGCEIYYDWPSWKGWFTGWYGDSTCEVAYPMCDFDCDEIPAIAGGTWAAKFNKKLSGSYTSQNALENALKGKYKAVSIELIEDVSFFEF